MRADPLRPRLGMTGSEGTLRPEHRSMVTRLHKLRGGDRAVVREIRGGHEVRQRLSSHGLHPGDAVEVIRAAFLRGPMLIAIHGVEVALGRGQAEAVEVELPERP